MTPQIRSTKKSARHESIADSGLGNEHLRNRRIVLELVAQVSHEDTEIFVVVHVRGPPHLTQQVAMGEDAPGVARRTSSRRYSIGVRWTSRPAFFTIRAARSITTS